MHLPPLMKLPLELHYEILSHMDLDDHPSATYVCPLWKNILSGNASQERRLNSYSRSACIGKWFIVNSILRSGKLKIKLHLTPQGVKTNIRFFWQCNAQKQNHKNECFEITDCPILDEPAVSWPLNDFGEKSRDAVIYGAVQELKIGRRYVRKLLLFQDRSFEKNDIVKVRDLVLDGVCEAVLPLLLDLKAVLGKRYSKVEALVQIIDARIKEPANCLIIHSKDGGM
ncbi:hypothetical protein TWF788_005193 [Orbilia oligospora]|uniref:F-box domain-containing protein n=1 Tax=Orbilia oligospora TaxID=2813651 RepID=A0A7C8TXE3_ORBOL|nr:hypothetical protein TWF788_005193 [Orbilia oligospora]